MTVLPNDFPVRTQILPSVWKGYILPRSLIMGEELPFKGVVPNEENVPQEWLDGMVNTFQNGSLADFYDTYLPKTLSLNCQEKILLRANSILKKRPEEWDFSSEPLIEIAAMDIAHNADEYGHHLFQTACFLKEQNQLPKECRFMFWRKVNPALYEEKELLEVVETTLREPCKKIPREWAQGAFYKWLKTDDSSEYLAQMQKMAALEIILAESGDMLVKRSISCYVHEHTSPAYQHRLRPRRRSWRSGIE